MDADPDLVAQRDRYLEFYAVDENNVGILAKLAELQLALNQKEHAEALLQRWLSLESDNAVAAFQLGGLYLSQGRHDEARDLNARLVENGHDTPAIRYNLAYACVESGAIDEAVEHLQPILTQTEAAPQANLLMARALHHQGDLDAGIEHALRAVEISPNHAETLSTLALLYYDNQETTLADDWARRAMELDERNHAAQFINASIALEELVIDQARAGFESLVEAFPNSGRAWNNLGLIHLNQGDIEIAIEMMQHSLELMPNFLGGYNALAWAHIVNEDLDQAKACLEKANRIDDRFGETHGGLAAIAAMQGDFNTAKKEMITARRLDPDSLTAAFTASLIAAHQGKEGESVEIIKKTLDSKISLGRSQQSISLLELVKKTDDQGRYGNRER